MVDLESMNAGNTQQIFLVLWFVFIHQRERETKKMETGRAFITPQLPGVLPLYCVYSGPERKRFPMPPMKAGLKTQTTSPTGTHTYSPRGIVGRWVHLLAPCFVVIGNVELLFWGLESVGVPHSPAVKTIKVDACVDFLSVICHFWHSCPFTALYHCCKTFFYLFYFFHLIFPLLSVLVLLSLDRHVQSHHGHQKPFRCKFCPFKSAYASRLKSHLHKAHTGETTHTHTLNNTMHLCPWLTRHSWTRITASCLSSSSQSVFYFSLASTWSPVD